MEHKQAISPAGPPFAALKAHFSAMTGCHFLRDLTRHLLIDGSYLLRIAEITSFEPNNPTEQKLGHPKKKKNKTKKKKKNTGRGHISDRLLFFFSLQ